MEVIILSDLTKNALEHSLKELLLKKSVNKITVIDLTKNCGINRMSFYYHFHDINELIEWSCLEDARKALEGKKTYDTWQEGFYQIFEVVLENIEKFLYKLTFDLMMNIITEKSKDINVQVEYKNFIADFYKYAFVGIMLDWIKNDMQEDPKEIIKKLSILVHGNIIDALQQYNNLNK